MSKFLNIPSLTVLVFCWLILSAAAGASVLTEVKVIHASKSSNQVDPGLTPIISELESVFRYTSYKLVSSKTMNLEFNQKGQMGLPGRRTLILTPLGADGRRISYQINILKENRSIFQTRILLKNNSSVTIGGPQFNQGVILLNIRGSVR